MADWRCNFFAVSRFVCVRQDGLFVGRRVLGRLLEGRRRGSGLGWPEEAGIIFMNHDFNLVNTVEL